MKVNKEKRGMRVSKEKRDIQTGEKKKKRNREENIDAEAHVTVNNKGIQLQSCYISVLTLS